MGSPVHMGYIGTSLSANPPLYSLLSTILNLHLDNLRSPLGTGLCADTVCDPL